MVGKRRWDKEVGGVQKVEQGSGWATEGGTREGLGYRRMAQGSGWATEGGTR